MKPTRHTAPLLGSLCMALALPCPAAAVSLSGTIYDHVIADADFEDGISGVVPGMVSGTLGADGLPDFVAAPGTGAVSSAASFDHWWTSAHGSKAYSITLDETAPGSGIFTFSDADFFPIDDELAGNEGLAHNYHFTMHLKGTLTFDGLGDGVDEAFSFTGDDDLWIYVDGTLFMDLGGVHGAASDSFLESELIAAGLSPDVAYDLDVFFAERHTVASSFSITTGFALAPVPEPATLALLGASLIGWHWHRRGRRAPPRPAS